MCTQDFRRLYPYCQTEHSTEGQNYDHLVNMHTFIHLLRSCTRTTCTHLHTLPFLYHILTCTTHTSTFHSMLIHKYTYTQIHIPYYTTPYPYVYIYCAITLTYTYKRILLPLFAGPPRPRR